MMSFPFLSLALAASQPVISGCDRLPGVLDRARVIDLSGRPSDLDLTLDVAGLAVRERFAVDWPTCPVQLDERVVGGWAFTRSGIPLKPDRGRLVTRPDRLMQDPEPDHPDVPGASFVASANLASAGRRMGVWRYPNGASMIGVYRTDEFEPLPILRSRKPILGIGYLPAPDSSGGMLSMWQMVSEGRYRFMTVEWDEKAMEPPLGR